MHIGVRWEYPATHPDDNWVLFNDNVNDVNVTQNDNNTVTINMRYDRNEECNICGQVRCNHLGNLETLR